MSNQLLTGTWGKETFSLNSIPQIKSTMSAELFDLTPKQIAIEMEKNKFAKFNKMQKTGQMVLSYNNQAYDVNSNENSDDYERFLTNQVSYGIGTKDDTATSTRRKLDGDIPVALGRSGQRVERGLLTSGLLGETLNDSLEPSKNTFVQRVWLYDDDKALYHKINGIPKASPATETSLQVGEVDLLSPEDKLNLLEKSHGRKDCDLRFNPVAKTGYKIFYDDQNGPTEQLIKHYKL